MDATSSAARKAEAKADEKRKNAMSGAAGGKKDNDKRGSKGGTTTVPKETVPKEKERDAERTGGNTQPTNEIGVVDVGGVGTSVSAVGIGTTTETTNKRKKRKAEADGPSLSVLRIGMKAGYNGKEGGLDFGCDHFSCMQMREYSIKSKNARDHYMQGGWFLAGTMCHGCHKLANVVDMKNRDKTNGAVIYY